VVRRVLSEFEVVENAGGDVVGQAMGDGVRVSTATPLRGVLLCLPRDPLLEHDSAYTAADFGLLDASGQTVVPMDATDTSLSPTRVCGRISITDGATLFPILRVPAWGSHDDSALDTGARIIFFICAVVYTLFFLATLACTALLFWDVSWRHKRQGVVKNPRFHCFVLLGIFDVFRSVFFFLLATDSFDSISIVVDYVLFELPIFILFSAFSMLVMLWVWILRQNAYPLPVALMNALMFAVFGVLIVLYDQFEKTEEDDACPLSTASTADTATQSDEQLILTIVYRVFIAAIGATISTAILSLGIGIALTIINVDSRAFHRKLKVWACALVAGLCLVTESLFLLVWQLLDGSITEFPYAAVILLFLEGTSQVMVLGTHHPRFSTARPTSSATSPRSTAVYTS